MAGTDDVPQALRDLRAGCDKAVIEHARDVIESLWSFYKTLEPQIDRAQALGAKLPFSKSGQIFDALMDDYERLLAAQSTGSATVVSNSGDAG